MEKGQIFRLRTIDYVIITQATVFMYNILHIIQYCTSVAWQTSFNLETQHLY